MRVPWVVTERSLAEEIVWRFRKEGISGGVLGVVLERSVVVSLSKLLTGLDTLAEKSTAVVSVLENVDLLLLRVSAGPDDEL